MILCTHEFLGKIEERLKKEIPKMLKCYVKGYWI
ncbi:MAG: hypothetical protein CM15mP106_2360 [Candidatus Neomarinimicrobiota bacterium]|nr:MAG: hypothetical protein CM15mP106_2360 [Candidatus Neomarinimicrobiota bacterium]